jgi:hypothetical protein
MKTTDILHIIVVPLAGASIDRLAKQAFDLECAIGIKTYFDHNGTRYRAVLTWEQSGPQDKVDGNAE